ncbi:hypothetical protein V6N13_081188 [Hibiscus sabdariffa]|uniref:Uncharacterized protein n=1 Tax=Hibiscus sabdariffa TaxID=183260 RepID=A0ABR2P9D5_9ROSI
MSLTSSPMLPSTPLHFERQIIPLSPTPPPPPPTAHDSIFQPVVPNLQAPSLSIHPNHETHTQATAGLDLNDNAVSLEIVSHSRPPRPRRNTSQTLKQGKSKTIPNRSLGPLINVRRFTALTISYHTT